MNYYAARQRLDTKRFDYTRMNDGVVNPEGYCREKVLCPENPIMLDGNYEAVECPEDCPTCHGEQRILNPDYCGSHDTAEEAEACFAKFIADQGARPISYGDWTGCEICGEPTEDGLMSCHSLGPEMALCDEHLSSEIFKAQLPKLAGTIAASW